MHPTAQHPPPTGTHVHDHAAPATGRGTTITLLTLVALLTLLLPTAPAAADKGFDATCDGIEHVLGSGTGLRAAKKDMAQTRGRWGTAAADNSGPDKVTNAMSFLPVAWTITVVDSVTGETLLADLPLLTATGHRNQHTITCTFVSLLPATDGFPNPGIATHTLTVVARHDR